MRFLLLALSVLFTLGCAGQTEQSTTPDAAGDARVSTGDGDADVSVESSTDATGNPDANVAPGDGGLGPACQRESDCPSGFDCGYLVGGCSAPGVCVPEPSSQGPFDGALTPLCACNGVLLLLGSNFYGGYAPVPTEPGIQMCPDAGHDVGADGGTCGAWGQGCETSGACCSGLQCIDPNQAVPGYCVP
jgi:hypothetical protein